MNYVIENSGGEHFNALVTISGELYKKENLQIASITLLYESWSRFKENKTFLATYFG